MKYIFVLLMLVVNPNNNNLIASSSEVSCLKTVSVSTQIDGALFIMRKGSRLGSGETTIEERKTPLYRIWMGIRQRCRNKNRNRYYRYGGRGINICERWDSFHNFVKDMQPTYSIGLQIDRINNDGNYEPSNCRWVTPKENNRNRLTTKLSLEIVNDIRRSDLRSGLLAVKYGVCRDTITKIRSGRLWK